MSNANRKLSETTFGPRHVQPHNPKAHARKKKKKWGGIPSSVDAQANRDMYRNKGQR